MNLVFTPGQKDAMARRYNTMRLNGIDGEYLNRDQIENSFRTLITAMMHALKFWVAICKNVLAQRVMML